MNKRPFTKLFLNVCICCLLSIHRQWWIQFQLPLIIVSTGYRKAIELLIEKKANVNDTRNKWLMTPLHYIALYDQKDWTDADNLSNSHQCICVFQKDFRSSDEIIALIRKITILSQLEYTELLINHGADVQAKDLNGKTPFDMAKSQKGANFMNCNNDEHFFLIISIDYFCRIFSARLFAKQNGLAWSDDEYYAPQNFTQQQLQWTNLFKTIEYFCKNRTALSLTVKL